MTNTERLFKSMENENKSMIGYLMTDEEVSLEIFNEDILKKIYDTHNIFMFLNDDNIYFITYTPGLMSLGAFAINACVPKGGEYPVNNFEIGDYFLELVDLLVGGVNILQCIVHDIVSEFGTTTNIYSQAVDNLRTLGDMFDDAKDMKTIINKLQNNEL